MFEEDNTGRSERYAVIHQVCLLRKSGRTIYFKDTTCEFGILMHSMALEKHTCYEEQRSLKKLLRPGCG